jgi:hypothetical protein
MSIELPVLRLGLAGFSGEQRTALHGLIQQVTRGHVWQIHRFSDSDVWCLNGSRTQALPDHMIRIAAGVPSERSLQLNLQEVDRPIGFSTPLAPGLAPLYTFNPQSVPSIGALLHKFEGWLQPVAAQFCLASRIIEQESVLGSGVYHVSLNGRLLAVVNMQGEVGVLPTANPADFDDAMWARRPASATDIPELFVRISLAQLMWQYALRTTRDVLPPRYRSGLVYFRRPPRLPQRLLRDSHLLLIRELACGPARFPELQQRTGLGDVALARDLAALYLVGAITSSPKRASVTRSTSDAADYSSMAHSSGPSALDPDSVPMAAGRRADNADLTAPAPMGQE